MSRAKIEFGDFQTPAWFCDQVCALLQEKGIEPGAILEPTCGQGNFLLAALDHFPAAQTAVGLDINAAYIDVLQQKIKARPDHTEISLHHADFFTTDWPARVGPLPGPLLLIGNPPWVTNSQLATLDSDNLPRKSNFQNEAGIAAITGASNFDISEAMILQMWEWAADQPTIVAMLCKTSVARKVLRHTWRQARRTGQAQLYMIDSKKIFGAAVAACLLVYDTTGRSAAKSCAIFPDLDAAAPLTTIGYRDRQIIANLDYFERWGHLQNKSKNGRYRWRSGIKHDCAAIMELEKAGDRFVNKLDETWELEDTYLYPLLKSSDLAHSRRPTPSRWLLVTQQTVGEETAVIATTAPQTWAYLTRHHDRLARRKSSIYRGRPPYSIFGVGDYTFAPWKVAISGLYKSLNFSIVAPAAGKPTVLDDTCYFLPCHSAAEAEFIAGLLNAEAAQQFFQSFIFWDAKRPVTAKILNRLDIDALARELGYGAELAAVTAVGGNGTPARQLRLLEEVPHYTNR